MASQAQAAHAIPKPQPDACAPPERRPPLGAYAATMAVFNALFAAGFGALAGLAGAGPPRKRSV